MTTESPGWICLARSDRWRAIKAYQVTRDLSPRAALCRRMPTGYFRDRQSCQVPADNPDLDNQLARAALEMTPQEENHRHRRQREGCVQQSAGDQPEIHFK